MLARYITFDACLLRGGQIRYIVTTVFLGIIEGTTNTLWIDVIKSTQMLCQSEAIFDEEAICNTPLWLHDYFELPIKRDWQD